ncbi:hypothetical protein NK718_16975 [Alsobacter sp. SYSU M60028]|uniref:Uncharacterized protein n=1 Tax=Alsobacter ponti TaxID=2962936 RepID=A0ABT1LGY5_9HYPH|nr:hypothetical protein [Alsobacter ponti]MCP8940221.1 hypothetical protein [Alsobacter ponti]
MNPDRRPEGAPTIKSVQHDAAWRARFYKGVAQPYPPGLGEADQGDWFTPFNRPGATPPYDLRGWHARTPREGARPASKSRS